MSDGGGAVTVELTVNELDAVLLAELVLDGVAVTVEDGDGENVLYEITVAP